MNWDNNHGARKTGFKSPSQGHNNGFRACSMCRSNQQPSTYSEMFCGKWYHICNGMGRYQNSPWSRIQNQMFPRTLMLSLAG